MAEAARQMGVSPPTIRRYAERLGLHRPRKSLKQHGPRIIQLVSSGRPVSEVAEVYNTTKGTVYSLLKRMGISLKPGSPQEGGR